jgi:hypothetical protein
LRQRQRFVAGKNAQLLGIGADYTNPRDADFQVTTVALVVGGSDTTILQKK